MIFTPCSLSLVKRPTLPILDPPFFCPSPSVLCPFICSCYKPHSIFPLARSFFINPIVCDLPSIPASKPLPSPLPFYLVSHQMRAVKFYHLSVSSPLLLLGLSQAPFSTVSEFFFKPFVLLICSLGRDSSLPFFYPPLLPTDPGVDSRGQRM